MAFKKNATYKELFEALEAIVRNTQCADMLHPTHGQVPMAHLARAARIIEGAKGPIADKRIIAKCIEIEMQPRKTDLLGNPEPIITTKIAKRTPKEARLAMEKLPKVRARAQRETT